MFKAVTNWWKARATHNELVKKSNAVQSKITQERYERLHILKNLEGSLKFYSDRDPNNIVRLVIPVYDVERKERYAEYYFRVLDDGTIEQIYPSYFSSQHSSDFLLTSKFDEETFYRRHLKDVCKKIESGEYDADAVSVSICKLGENFPLVSIVEALKISKKAKPGVYPHLWNGNYLRKIEGDVLFLTDKENHTLRRVHAWQLDLVRHTTDESPIDPTTLPDFIVSDYDIVDRKLIPATDFRRWMVITELDHTSNDCAFTVIPKGIAAGKIRYFALNFTFDQIDLGGVSFNPLSMIQAAVYMTTIKCEREYPKTVDSPTAPFEPSYTKSRAVLNLDNVKVIHDNNTLTFRGYLLQQKKHKAFKASKPYLSPYSGGIEIEDQVIGFDHENNLVNYFHHECTGDCDPNDKRPYY